ncbi:MAG TPA: hypothetical protein VMA72_22695 [Streptosporangiaceae bacterium]|nr:hypothetical protein [Streptosporangiaceae bacterium]
MARWRKGEQTVQFLVDRGRLEAFESSDLTGLATARIHRAALRLNATAVAALQTGTSMARMPRHTTPTGWRPKPS